jgi:segregation and condensation protein A
MSAILTALRPDAFTVFTSLFTIEEGRRGVVVTLLAVLELVKGAMIELVQTELFGPIYVKVPTYVDESPAT